MSLKYILTFDYELFGSGRGDIHKHIIAPTQRIIDIMGKHNIKATFFVEILEVEAILSLKKSYPKQSREYRDAVALENQIHNLIMLGHDIQLHLHPQWYGAKYINGNWDLNFDLWRFSSLPYRTEGLVPGKYDLIKYGKFALEQLIQKVKQDYKCVAFRAGGYNVGTDKSSLQALLENDIILDSSICPGYFTQKALCQYDYRDAPDEMCYWLSSDSLIRPVEKKTNDKTCIELPLLTINSSKLDKISFSRILNQIRNKKFKHINYLPNDKQEYSNEIAAKNSNYDICLSSRRQILKFNEKINYLNTGDNTTITLIGHPKDYSFFSPLSRILKKINSESFITVDFFVKEVKNVYK
ncbi:hypothetical protein [Pseudoalteromonas sp. Z9A5]|uniref:hypothetical protein n=1 Tax=Pseudoalteromonas sp. Z9A5 TaxID=2686355 RepID=UPI00140AF0B5|nr:hypothetical protein [Pseudoalteromonas sp. Z9A5]